MNNASTERARRSEHRFSNSGRTILSGLAKAATVAAVFLTVTAPAHADEPSRHDPIIFVHGLSGNTFNWEYMVHEFESDGWSDAELNRKTYSSIGSNIDNAQDLADEVDRVLQATGAKKVDIITHSMGGVSSRWFLKFMEGTPKVDDWVSLAGPNHGTAKANFCYTTLCKEARPGSDLLTQLNAGDETPGTTRYGTWWSPCDEWVSPPDSTVLDGAANTKTSCLSHNGILLNSTVYSQVRDFVR